MGDLKYEVGKMVIPGRRWHLRDWIAGLRRGSVQHGLDRWPSY